MAFLKHACSFVFMLTLLLAPVRSTAETFRDNEIIAAYLYHLLYFVEWSDQAPSADTINICILGENPFKELAANLEVKKLENKRVTFLPISFDTLASQSCRILFISDSEAANFPHMLEQLPKQHVLLVSNIKLFAKYGGMIGLSRYNNAIKLEINLKSLSNAQLKIDPNLLEVALNVY